MLIVLFRLKTIFLAETHQGFNSYMMKGVIMMEKKWPLMVILTRFRMKILHLDKMKLKEFGLGLLILKIFLRLDLSMKRITLIS